MSRDGRGIPRAASCGGGHREVCSKKRSARAGVPTPTSPNPLKIPRSHFLPRTRAGWIAATAFCLTMALAQPPIVHGLMNRIEPWILGMPFLFAYLLGVYCLVIAVLVWAARKGL